MLLSPFHVPKQTIWAKVIKKSRQGRDLFENQIGVDDVEKKRTYVCWWLESSQVSLQDESMFQGEILQIHVHVQ